MLSRHWPAHNRFAHAVLRNIFKPQSLISMAQLVPSSRHHTAKTTDHAAASTTSNPATCYRLRHSNTTNTANCLLSKSNPVQRLTRELAKPAYNPAPITLGNTTDPYSSCAQQLATTRQLLELLLAHRHPVHIITKNHLIVKDLDILAELAQQRLCTVELCVNTLDSELGGKIEPRTSSPAARVKAIARLSAAGIPVCAMLSPVIPVVNDSELEELLQAVKEAGAITAGYEYLNLPADVTHQFDHWLQRHFPEQARRIFNLSQANVSTTNPKTSNASSINNSAREFANMVHQRFLQTCHTLGLNRTGLPALDTTRFAVPTC